jgi:formylmethanofuran dehydrogenase subunit E
MNDTDDSNFKVRCWKCSKEINEEDSVMFNGHYYCKECAEKEKEDQFLEICI